MALFWWYVASAVLTMVQARAKAKMLRGQGRIAEVQGQITLEGAMFEAELARKRGAQQFQAIQTDSRRAVGGAVVQVAASGVELEGSPLLAIADQIWEDERAAAQALVNAQGDSFTAESRGRAAQATGRAEGSRLDALGRDVETAGWLGAMSAAVKGYARDRNLKG